MFRNDLIDGTDPRYLDISMRAPSGLALAAQGTDSTELKLSGPEVAGGIFNAWASIHGMAHLVIDDKAQSIFPEPDAGRIVDDYLPQTLERLFGKGPSSKRSAGQSAM